MLGNAGQIYSVAHTCRSLSTAYQQQADDCSSRKWLIVCNILSATLTSASSPTFYACLILCPRHRKEMRAMSDSSCSFEKEGEIHLISTLNLVFLFYRLRLKLHIDFKQYSRICATPCFFFFFHSSVRLTRDNGIIR